MPQHDDGGAAFPRPRGYNSVEPVTDGMSLRDYFAAKAMQTMLQEKNIGQFEMNRRAIAHEAYCVADTMLQVRKIPIPPGAKR